MQDKFTIKKLLSQSFIYWVGIMFSKAIGFIMIPYYTHNLAPDQYGVLEIVVLTVDVISLVAGMQLTAGLAKYYEEGVTEKDRKIVVSTSFILITILCFVVFGTLLFFSSYISLMVFKSVDEQTLFKYVFITAFFNMTSQIPLFYLRILEKARLFLMITLSQVILNVSLTIYFVSKLHLGVTGIVLSNAIVWGGIFLILGSRLIINVGIGLDRSLAKKLVHYSLPLIPGVLALFVMNYSDRFILNYYLPLEQVGIYALAYKFGFLITVIIIEPFALVWTAKMFNIYSQPDSQITLNRILVGFGFTLSTFALVISYFSKEVVYIASPESYHDAARVIPFIVSGYFFYGLLRIIYTPLYARKKTGTISKINVVAALTNFGLNILLIPIIGIFGAALSTYISFMVMILIGYYVSTKVLLFRWEINKIIKVFALMTIFTLIGMLIDTGNMIFDVSLKIVGIFVYLAFIYLAKVFDLNEIKMVMHGIYELSIVKKLVANIK